MSNKSHSQFDVFAGVGGDFGVLFQKVVEVHHGLDHGFGLEAAVGQEAPGHL